MFVVIKLKKYVVFGSAVLLFLLTTAIIIYRVQPAAAQASTDFDASDMPILIIDPGHGGLDGGALAADGTTESSVNLSIGLKMREIGRIFGTDAIMTRTSEALDYPDENASIHNKKVWDQKARVSLINSTENAILISVHQNTYPDPRPSGCEVLYGKTVGAKEFAEVTQNHLISQLCPENRRVAAPISDKIYLMKQVTCPAILVECGFLSNPEEAAKLESDVYRTELALILMVSYFQYTQ